MGENHQILYGAPLLYRRRRRRQRHFFSNFSFLLALFFPFSLLLFFFAALLDSVQAFSLFFSLYLSEGRISVIWTLKVDVPTIRLNRCLLPMVNSQTASESHYAPFCSYSWRRKRVNGSRNHRHSSDSAL